MSYSDSCRNYYYLRSVLDELNIEEMVDKNSKDIIIKIKFNPNYK